MTAAGAAPPLVLAVEAALGPCAVALVQGDEVHAERCTGPGAGPGSPTGRGATERLAAMAAEVFAAAAVAPADLGAVAVTTGPGSFTGLRAAIAFASGLARAVGVPLVGVPVARAFAAGLPARAEARPLWVLVASRAGRAYLVRGERAQAVALAALPRPDGPITLVGDAAPAAAAPLQMAGFDVWLPGLARPRPRDVAAAAAAMLRDGLPGGPVLPLYVEAPEHALTAAPARAPPRDPAMVPIGAAHVPELATLHAAAFAPGEQWDEPAFATLLAQPGVFGLLDAGSGFVLARVAADEAELLTLAVAPPRRRQGRGRGLVERAKREAARRGARALYLEVAQANAAAQALYASAGFVPVGRRPAYYPDGGDAVVLRSALG